MIFIWYIGLLTHEICAHIQDATIDDKVSLAMFV